jgi:topoisomerase IA-like protein
MPQITLTLTDTEARAIAALEAIDGRTVDQRFAPYLRDIVQNAAGLREDDEPDDIEDRLVKMERRGAEAKAAREQEAAAAKAAREQEATTTTEEPTE